jgi:hypothetical protein
MSAIHNLQNHIVVTNEDSGRKYLIVATEKPEFEKWEAEFGNGEHEDDHDERVAKYLLTSDDSLALIVEAVQELWRKLDAMAVPRKKVA